MIYIEIDEIDFSTLFEEGLDTWEHPHDLMEKFAKISMKLYLNVELTTTEKSLMNTIRDYCIREASKNEIRFK